MNFDFTREESLLQKSVREYIRDKILPFAGDKDREGPTTQKAVYPFLKGLFPFGYIGSIAPSSAGGPGLSNIETGIIFLELGKVWASLGAIFLATSNVISALLNSINTPRIKHILPRLLSGEMVGAFAVTEPLAGTDVLSIQTTADLRGGHFILNGEKVWVSNGIMADVVLVAAITRGTATGEGAIGVILVEKGTSSFATVEMPKMGLKGLSTAKLTFDDCRVPKENYLGPFDRQAFSVSFLPDICKCQIAAIAIGIAEAALDASISYARQRVQFGKVLGEFQMIQKMIADMATGIDAAGLLCFRALKMLDDGTARVREIEMAKAFAVETAVDAASKAIQIHGAYGYSDEFPLERFYRDACCIALMGGDPDLARLNVARHIMGVSTVN